MQEMTVDQKPVHQYDDIVNKLKEAHPELIGTTVDISVTDDKMVSITILKTQVFMTPEQAVDLMKELRRAVVRTKPRALKYFI